MPLPPQYNSIREGEGSKIINDITLVPSGLHLVSVEWQGLEAANLLIGQP